ncbi:MAG: hypothetical protein QOG13_445 [Sphingomonadales bacterium]|jgi:hypothetical protein|nr:hypothetical protein [Sphingomonadales bacterium]MEA3044825.1 hypothetical protein [Sphingomonadales bacterium]
MTDVHYRFDVPKGRQKFRELIVYVSAKCETDPSFGATKLNKILFYADMTAFERFGEPLTGEAYLRLDRGPAPMTLLPVRRGLVAEGAIRVDERQTMGNHTQKRLVALRSADTDLFTQGELRIVDEIINDLWGKTADEVSRDSHRIAWHALGEREMIPYEAAFLSDELPTAHDISEARELNEQYGWGLQA